MDFEDYEDLFEGFGEPAAAQAPAVHETPAEVRPQAPTMKPAFSWAGLAGGLAAVLWVAAAIGGPLSYFGVDAVMAMDPALQAGLIALAFGPALLFWLGASAAGEALKARKLTAELTRITHEQRSPVEQGEAHVQRLSTAVKHEIEALNDAVSTAMTRLSELEDVAQRNTQLFDTAIHATRENALFMAGQLEHERGELTSLNNELRGQTDSMSQSIGRQVRLMREASKLVKTEITAAEDALETHLSSFSSAATLMAERTASFHYVADSATAATGQLNGAMAGMLDGLSEATRMTDAARQSAEQAVLAANETASAVRETTRTAVVEAKRAAQTIRGETQALQDAAIETLGRLQAAAHAARQASEDSQAAADRHAASIEKRLSSLAATAGAKKVAMPATRPVEHKIEAKLEARRDTRADADTNLYAAAQAAVARGSVRPQVRPHVRAQTPLAKAPVAQAPANDQRHDQRKSGGFKGFGGWGNFLPQNPRTDAGFKQQAANEPTHDEDFELVRFAPKPKQSPDIVLKGDAIDLVLASGVDLDKALAAADLEMIAQRARQGAGARRQAVSDAAPAAVARIARHIKRHEEARQIAAGYRARPDLTKSDNKSESSDLVRCYLLIDAALA